MYQVTIINPLETPRMSKHIEMAKILADAKGKEKPIVGFVFGPLGILSMLTGLSELMIDCLKHKKVVLEAVEKIAKAVHDKGAMVMIHNCGNGIYFKEQIERMHPEAISYLYNPADCKTMAETKEKYGNQTTLIGHIDPGFLMTCSEESLRKLCCEQIDVYKKDGGFILATGCEYPALLDDTWAKVIVDEAKTYGKY